MPTDPVSTKNGSHELRPEFRRGEIPLAGLASTLLLTAPLFLPLVGALLPGFARGLLQAIGILAFPLVAVPVVRLTHRAGLGAGLLASFICVGLLLGLGPAGLALFGALLTALPTGFTAAVRRGAEPSRTYLALCLAGVVLIAGGFLLRSAAGGRTMRQEIESAFDVMAPAAIQSYSRANMDAETIERVKRTLATARDFTRKFWIGLVGASWVLGSAIGFYVGASTARPAPSAERTRFERLRVPAAAAALFIASGAASVVLPSPGREIAGNLLLPVAALYFVAGLSIICHFARRWFRARILRIGLYALLVYFPLNVGVGLLGLFDWYADFRRRGEGAIEKS